MLNVVLLSMARAREGDSAEELKYDFAYDEIFYEIDDEIYWMNHFTCQKDIGFTKQAYNFTKVDLLLR